MNLFATTTLSPLLSIQPSAGPAAMPGATANRFSALLGLPEGGATTLTVPDGANGKVAASSRQPGAGNGAILPVAIADVAPITATVALQGGATLLSDKPAPLTEAASQSTGITPRISPGPSLSIGSDETASKAVPVFGSSGTAMLNGSTALTAPASVAPQGFVSAASVVQPALSPSTAVVAAAPLVMTATALAVPVTATAAAPAMETAATHASDRKTPSRREAPVAQNASVAIDPTQVPVASPGLPAKDISPANDEDSPSSATDDEPGDNQAALLPQIDPALLMPPSILALPTTAATSPTPASAGSLPYPDVTAATPTVPARSPAPPPFTAAVLTPTPQGASVVEAATIASEPGPGASAALARPTNTPGVRPSASTSAQPAGSAPPAPTGIGAMTPPAVIPSSSAPALSNGAPTTAPVASVAPLLAEPPATTTLASPRSTVAPVVSQAAATPAPLALPAAAPFTPAPLVAGTTAPASQLFAAAIEASGRQDRAAAATAAPTTTADALAALGLAPTTAMPVASISPGQPAIDMHHGAWPSQMIEQIEKLRDTADAGSTRIRVVPDALGSIDISLRRHDSGTVQVALVADRPATQALIAEARPELARLGEQRGLRLDDATRGGPATSGGDTGNQPHFGDSPRRAPASAPLRPASALSTTETIDAAEARVA